MTAIATKTQSLESVGFVITGEPITEPSGFRRVIAAAAIVFPYAKLRGVGSIGVTVGIKESFASVAKSFLLLLPKGEYSRDELVSKFNMILQVADIESIDSANRLSTVIYRLRKSGILTLEIIRKDNTCLYRKF